MKEHLIITPKQLDEWLKDSAKNILLLDLSEKGIYQSKTVANAVHMPYEGLVIGELPNPGKLPAASGFAAALASVGYDGSQHIVAFDDEFGMKAARLYWTLRLAGDGKNNFSYLNGGLAAWENARETQGETAANDATSAPAVAARDIEWNSATGPRATKEQIMQSLPKKEFFLWDTRSAGEYSGKEKRAERGGHIPGAHHLEWSRLLNEDGTIKSAEEIRPLLTEFFAQRANDQPIVAYCQAHRRSAFAFMVADYIGIDILGYDGSWQEWGNLSDTPIETTA